MSSSCSCQLCFSLHIEKKISWNLTLSLSRLNLWWLHTAICIKSQVLSVVSEPSGCGICVFSALATTSSLLEPRQILFYSITIPQRFFFLSWGTLHVPFPAKDAVPVFSGWVVFTLLGSDWLMKVSLCCPLDLAYAHYISASHNTQNTCNGLISVVFSVTFLKPNTMPGT